MKAFEKLAVVGCLLGGLVAAPTFAAEFGVSLAAIGNMADADVDGDTTVEDAEDKLGWGVSAMFNAQMTEMYSIETGVAFINRSFRYGSDNFNFTQSQNVLQIPVLGRIWIGKILSVGAGPFVQFPVGDVSNEFTLGDENTAGVDIGRDSSEAGLVGAVTANIAVSEKTGVFIEGRYNYGLFQLDGDDDYNNTNDLSALAGVRVQF